MKRTYTTLLIFFCLTMLPGMSDAYSQDARSFLQQSLQAYGAWGAVKTVEYTVSGHRDAGTQGYEYKSGARQPYSARRIIDFTSRHLYESNLNTFPGGYAFHFATAVQDTSAINYDLAGTRGGKVYNKGGKAIAEGRFRVANNHIAFLKVQELVQSVDSLHAIDSAQFVIITRFNNQKLNIGNYYFERSTKLLQTVTSNQSGQAVSLGFGHYKNKGGRWDNGVVTLTTNGKNSYEEKIIINNVNRSFDTALLSLPKGYTLNKALPPSKPQLIAKDVYLIERLAGDRNVVFVNMDAYIAVIEAPVSTDLSKQVIQMIREVIPNKPIQYVFTTHYHSDHTGGLRQYAYEGAQFIMAAPTQAYVKELTANPATDDWAKSGRTLPEMITITGTYRLQDANHTIDFYEVPNSHAKGMALAHFPKEKIIYQGDLVSVPMDGTLPLGIEVTQDLQRFVVKKGLEYNRIIGHHGHHFITPEMLRQILKRKPAAVKTLK